MYERIKAHVGRHKSAYYLGSLIGVSAITYVLARQITIQQGMSNSATFTIGSSQTINVIQSLRQGPPSWVIRCLETDEIFTSQRAAALAKGISESDLSQHLNNLHEHVNNLHFERICLAA